MRKKFKINKKEDKFIIKEKKWIFYPFYSYVIFSQTEFDTVDDAIKFICDLNIVCSKKRPGIIYI